MKIALLTSSRADYSIYLPLIKLLSNDPLFELQIIAFGTHLSKLHGKSIDKIIQDGFVIARQIDTFPDDDTPTGISASMGKTMVNFSKLWQSDNFDLILALGDRYEMFAACASSVPFGIPIAHIHGGETTLGAIDDVFRNSITQMAAIHFTTCKEYQNRVIEMKGSDENVYNVGALSIDNLSELPLYSIDKFKDVFGIDLSTPYILITFHPETVEYRKNHEYVNELVSALREISGYRFIITMPNADTMGNMIRAELENFIATNDHAVGVESFGTLGYLSCMKYASMLLGNTSSGFVEASFFPKYVINLGERQRGRILTSNIYSCPIDRTAIKDAVNRYKQVNLADSINIYGNGSAASKIVSILKKVMN